MKRILSLIVFLLSVIWSNHTAAMCFSGARFVQSDITFTTYGETHEGADQEKLLKQTEAFADGLKSSCEKKIPTCIIFEALPDIERETTSFCGKILADLKKSELAGVKVMRADTRLGISFLRTIWGLIHQLIKRDYQNVETWQKAGVLQDLFKRQSESVWKDAPQVSSWCKCMYEELVVAAQPYEDDKKEEKSEIVKQVKLEIKDLKSRLAPKAKEYVSRFLSSPITDPVSLAKFFTIITVSAEAYNAFVFQSFDLFAMVGDLAFLDALYKALSEGHKNIKFIGGAAHATRCLNNVAKRGGLIMTDSFGMYDGSVLDTASKNPLFNANNHALKPDDIRKITAPFNSLCHVCSKTSDKSKLSRCSHCQVVYYCGAGCQGPAWGKHKELFAKFQKPANIS